MITLTPEDKKRMEAIRQGNQKRIAERHATLLFAQTIDDDAAAMEVAALYPEWSGASVAYTVGHRVLYEGQLYKCLTAHTSQAGWKPTTAPSLWVATANPAEEWPLIPNPIPSANPWMKGQNGKTADGRKWASKLDNNVWQPSAYPAGWEEVK